MIAQPVLESSDGRRVTIVAELPLCDKFIVLGLVADYDVGAISDA